MLALAWQEGDHDRLLAMLTGGETRRVELANYPPRFLMHERLSALDK